MANIQKYICKPTKIAIYINSSYKSLSAIKKELGCDVIINGGLYNMYKFIPYCWLKKDSKILHSEVWNDWGYGWATNKLILDSSVNIAKYSNFISCVTLVRNSAAESLNYPAALGGARGRTVIGLLPSGETLVYCTKDGTSYAATPEKLQKEMLSYGCTSALMLDGGGSSQCITPDGSVTSSRIVQNCIAIWIQKIKDSTQPINNTNCPYPVPTRNLYYGNRGEDVKWLQWQLKQKGYNLGTPDGIFGPKTWNAVWNFQKTWTKLPDGICGPNTRNHLLGVK